MTHRIELLGVPGSPYTRKLLALLRYRHIPYSVIWGSHRNPPAGYPEPKVKLLPTIYLPDGAGVLEAMVDTTPIAERLERDYAGRAAIPDDPALAYCNALIEDYADEWLTKAMFHYRWYHQEDRVNAGPLLAHWGATTRSDEDAQAMSAKLTEHQYNRLYVVGSNDITADTIEQSYVRLVNLLDRLLALRGFVLGARPATADFALYGQLTQLGVVEPTPAAILSKRSPRLRTWIDTMEDLSGLDPQPTDWFTPEQAFQHLRPLLQEIGRVYVPFLLANAAAAESGALQMDAEIDGRPWSQPVFPYQVKCLERLRLNFFQMSQTAASATKALLEGTGCEPLTFN